MWQQQQKNGVAAAAAAAAADNKKPLSHADLSAMNEYAETTMRELLSLYGLPREAAELTLASGKWQLPICHQTICPLIYN